MALLISACQQKNNEKHVEAKGEQSKEEISENADWINIDTATSVLTWIGSKPTGQHNGIIPLSEGKIAVLNNELVGGNFTINIQELIVMDMLQEPDRNEKLRDHLLSEDFFMTDSFPSASFEITSIIPYDSALLPADQDQFHSDFKPEKLRVFMVKNPTHFISGNLTIKGITKNITYPAEIKVTPQMIRAEAKFNIDRTDWNITYSNEASVIDKAKDKFIYNTVNVGVYLEALWPENKADTTSVE